MGKRRQRPEGRLTPAEEKRMRQWRTCGVLALILVAAIGGIALVIRLFHRDHPHLPPPHGGVIVSVGEDHMHVEALVEKGNALKLYTYGADLNTGLEVESQMLTAQVSRQGVGESVPVLLIPVPQAGDSKGKTSQFAGKLPREFWGQPLTVRIPVIQVAGKQLTVDVALPASDRERGGDLNEAEEKSLYFTPGGKYTEADIQANGNTTAPRKYQAFRPNHDERLKPGDRICPVTGLKSDPKCLWIVSGKTYEFCCPPCIDEFVRRAKERPAMVEEPDKYLNR